MLQAMCACSSVLFQNMDAPLIVIPIRTERLHRRDADGKGTMEESRFIETVDLMILGVQP